MASTEVDVNDVFDLLAGMGVDNSPGAGASAGDEADPFDLLCGMAGETPAHAASAGDDFDPLTLLDGMADEDAGVAGATGHDVASWWSTTQEEYVEEAPGSANVSGQCSSRSMLSVRAPLTNTASLGQPLCRGAVGLQNLGNTCFMNSALQCLSNVPELRQWFTESLENQSTEIACPTEGKLASSFQEVMGLMWKEDTDTVCPGGLKLEIGKLAPQFMGYQQHDSMELIEFLLDGLKEDLNRVRGKLPPETVESVEGPGSVAYEEARRRYERRHDSHVDSLFLGFFRSSLECPNCNKVAINFDAFLSAKLPLSKEVDAADNTENENAVLQRWAVLVDHWHTARCEDVLFAHARTFDGLWIDEAFSTWSIKDGLINGKYEFTALGEDKCTFKEKTYVYCGQRSTDGKSISWDDGEVWRRTKLNLSRPREQDAPVMHMHLEKCLERLTERERLSRDNAWCCQSCGSHVQAFKQLQFVSLPEVLVLQLKRFTYTAAQRERLNAEIVFPLEGLDLSPYCASSADAPERLFDLAAVSVHQGDLGGGHYVAFARSCIDGQWHFFNDSSVQPVSAEEVARDTVGAYVLFYIRRDKRPSTWPCVETARTN